MHHIGDEHIHINSRHDSRVSRVAALYAPLGADHSPVLAWKFEYDLEKDRRSSKPIGGNTTVTDALGHRKVYHFSGEHRLTAIDHCLDNGQLYRSEKMVWGTEGELNTLLLSRGLEDGSGNIVCCRKYTYDHHGNALEESLSGNLSGWCLGKPSLTGKDPHDCDCYKKTYTYTQSGLTTSEDEGRKKITYQYWEGTDLIKMKLVHDEQGRIRERYYFEYDPNAVLVFERIDDGNSPDFQNWSGITEMRIQRTEPTNATPKGLPRKVQESCLNLATGQEELIRRVEYEYTKEGWPTRESVYDRNGNFCYVIQKSYNSWGKVLQEVDPLGQITSYQYDNNGNVVFKQTPNPDYHILYTYDYSNRLVREEEVYNNGTRLVKSYAYDFVGNRIASTDFSGNTTHFRYDNFCRLVEKINPSISDGKQGLYQPIDRVAYDIFNNPVEKTDSNHFTTRLKYTHRGKPYCIEYPDGGLERSVYHHDGQLEKTIDVNGMQTVFTYDYNNRKTKEEKYSPQGALLCTKRWIYNAFHLLVEIDEHENETKYSYDYAGRLTKVTKGDAEARYVYDALNRQSEIWEIYEPGKYRKTVKAFDNLNRVVQQKVENEQGQEFSCQSFSYDWDGNFFQEIVHTSQGFFVKTTVFNSHKKPVKITMPDGSETRFFYNYDCRNAYGQTVYSEEKVDPNGNRTIKVMDACGRLALEERKDAFGNTVKRVHYVHDGEGNLIQRTEDVIVSGQCQRSILTEFRYDQKNRQIAVIEASGDPLQKITRQEFRLTGELANIIKPDGVVLSIPIIF